MVVTEVRRPAHCGQRLSLSLGPAVYKYGVGAEHKSACINLLNCALNCVCKITSYFKFLHPGFLCYDGQYPGTAGQINRVSFKLLSAQRREMKVKTSAVLVSDRKFTYGAQRSSL